MTCLIIQHIEGESSYAIGDAISHVSVAQQHCRVFDGDPIPSSVEGLNGLVVMGGPMSAISDEGFPTRRAEIELIRKALALELPILGICLGAQLLASAAGGTVVRGEQGPEIGWGQIILSKAAWTDPLLADIPSPLEVLHWHGDTMVLPPDSEHLASSDRYPNQAFRVGPCAWGFQFHLEVDDLAVATFVEGFGQEAMEAGVSPIEIVARSPQALSSLGESRATVTTRFAGLVREHAGAAPP